MLLYICIHVHIVITIISYIVSNYLLSYNQFHAVEEIITEELKETMTAKQQLDKLLVYNDMLNDKPS